MRNSSSLVVLVLALLIAGRASASTDINGLFDARSHGMGGTGVAYVDSAGAIPINPALLDQIGKLTLSLDVFLIKAQPTAPYTIWHLNEDGTRYTNYESIRSDAAMAPLPFLGFAYRLHPRFVLGLAAYPVIGQGTSAKYYPAPDQFPNLVATNKAAMGLLEVGEALSIKILDNLSAAVMWRVTYMTQTVSTPAPTGIAPAGVLLDTSDPGNPKVVNADQKIEGLNLKGFQFGLLYKPTPQLRLGFSYRSLVEVWGKDGMTTTRLAGTEIKIPTQGGFKNPHSFRVGAAYSAFDNKLLLALDLKYLLYKQAFDRLKQIRKKAPYDKDAEWETSYTDAYWKNSWVVQVGAEYKVADAVALRTGYTVLETATNPDYAPAFMAPAGISHLVTAGLGLNVLDSLDIDLAAGYVTVVGQVNKATDHNAGVGEYSSRGGEFSLQAHYHY